MSITEPTPTARNATRELRAAYDDDEAMRQQLFFEERKPRDMAVLWPVKASLRRARP